MLKRILFSNNLVGYCGRLWVIFPLSYLVFLLFANYLLNLPNIWHDLVHFGLSGPMSFGLILNALYVPLRMNLIVVACSLVNIIASCLNGVKIRLSPSCVSSCGYTLEIKFTGNGPSPENAKYRPYCPLMR